MLNIDKSKMSKRQGDVALSDYHKNGYLPEALINFMVLLGWNPGTEKEIFTLAQLVKEFSIEKVYENTYKTSGFESSIVKEQLLKNIFDVELFISSSKNLTTKGTLLRNVLNFANEWTDQDINYNIERFIDMIAFFYYKTMHRNFYKFEGRLFNINQDDGTGTFLSLLNTIYFDDLPNKQFLLTTLNIDVRQESAEFTAIELKDISVLDEAGFIYDYNPNLEITQTFRIIDNNTKSENNPNKKPKRPIDYRFGSFGYLTELISRNKNRRFNNL
jgi:glutamyl/glutaminyl-tRNA synthetase